MFTGIIQECGRLDKKVPQGTKTLLVFKSSRTFLKGAKLGESIAVEGVCLTAIRKTQDTFSVEAIPETLRDTTLGALVVRKSPVNLERALRLGDSLGGHIVSGHVDGTGVIESLKDRGENYFLRIRAPRQITRQMAPKGSVAIDGISLTVQKINSTSFEIGIIPHTWKVTSLCSKCVGSRVNIELDMFMKYIEEALKNRSKLRRL